MNNTNHYGLLENLQKIRKNFHINLKENFQIKIIQMFSIEIYFYDFNFNLIRNVLFIKF